MSGSPAPQINTEFVNTLDQAVDFREKQRKDQENKNYKFAKAMVELEAEKQLLEANGKLSSKKGADAFPEADRLRRDLNDKVSGFIAASKMPEEYKRAITAELMPEVNARYNRNAIPWQYAQGNALREGVLKERVAAIGADLVQNGSDPEYIDRVAIDKLYQSVVDYGESQYGDLDAQTPDGFTGREAVQQMARSTVSKSLTESAIGQAQLGSIDRAETILRKFDLEITEPDRLKALKAIEKAKADGTNGMAMTMARAAIDEYGDNVEAIQRSIEAQSGGNMDVYKTAMSFVTSVQGAQKKQRELNRQRTLGQAVSAVDSGQPMTDALINSLDPEDRPKFRKYGVDMASGRLTVTNPNTYNKLMSVVLDDPQKLINGEVSLEAAKPELNREDYVMFERMRTQLAKDQSKESLRVANKGYRVAADVVTNYLNERGIMDPISVGKSRNFAMNYVNELVELNPKIGEAELRKKVQQAVYDRGMTVTERNRQIMGINIPFTSVQEQELAPVEVRVKPQIREKIIQLKGNLTDQQIREAARQLKEKYPALDVFE